MDRGAGCWLAAGDIPRVDGRPQFRPIQAVGQSHCFVVTAFSDAYAASALADYAFAPSFLAVLSVRASIHTSDLPCTGSADKVLHQRSAFLGKKYICMPIQYKISHVNASNSRSGRLRSLGSGPL